MRLKNESDILDPAFRKRIIDEIEGPENKFRKQEAFVRHQVYKDETDFFVIEMLTKKFKPETVKQMEYAVSNISLVRKAIDKLARVYADGVTRKIDESEEDTKKIQLLEKEMDFNTHIKTINRFLKLQRNTALYIKPCPFADENQNELFTIKPLPLAPYLYDVIEDYCDRTKPICFILSNYDYQNIAYTPLDPASSFVRFGAQQKSLRRGDSKDQVIADNPEDEGEQLESKKEYIWWTDKYHFTTKGSKIIDPDTGAEMVISSFDDFRITNPIGKKPIVDFAIDRDNSFWAKGGRDLVHAGILVNSLITNYHHIGVEQGYGQIVVTGEKGTVPTNLPMGPTNAVILEHSVDQPAPTFEFKNAGAPLTELMAMVEMYVALTLTTNNLSTTGVSTQLTGGTAAPSGIAMLIDKAESMEDVNDQRQVFADNEPIIWDIINKWITAFNQEGNLDPALSGLQLDETFNMTLEFNDAKSLQSEAEKLNNLKLRKELGINTFVELIKIDQPDLTDEQAEEKLKNIMEEKISRMEQTLGPGLAQEKNKEQNNLVPENEKEKKDENEDDDNQS